MSLPSPEHAEWERRAVGRATERARSRSADRAQRVVAAVRALASERNTAEFTMSDVAAAAGVPLRSLYRQFPSRDELLLALLEEEARLGAALLTEELLRATTPGRRLHLFVVGLWNFMVEGSGYAGVLVREHLRLAERHPDKTRVCLEPLVTLLAEAMEEGGTPLAGRGAEAVADPFVLFSVLLAQIQAVLLFRPEEPQGRAAEGIWHLFGAMVDAPDVVSTTLSTRGG